MVRADVIEMFGAITSMYPSATAFAQATDTMITTWYKMLSDLPKQSVAIVLKQHASVSTFPPSIAEIRKGVAELKASPYKPHRRMEMRLLMLFATAHTGQMKNLPSCLRLQSG